MFVFEGVFWLGGDEVQLVRCFFLKQLDRMKRQGEDVYEWISCWKLDGEDQWVTTYL